MINKKILVIASYPITKPLHGGQKRAKAIVEFYKSIYRDVKFISIYHEASYPDHSPGDIPLGQKEYLRAIDEAPHMIELKVGESIDKDAHVRSFFAKALRQYNPDIISIEQPYLYAGLSTLLKELSMWPKIVYSSQNIEYKMKETIYGNQNISGIRDVIDATKELEEKFSREADLVIAVSKEDAEWHRLAGAKSVVVAPNGIEKAAASKNSIKYWSDFKKQNKCDKIISFVGSGHPPNYTGFIDMLGADSGFLPKGTKIIMAGGVSEYFKITYKYGKNIKKHQNFWKNIIPVGFLEEDILAGLVSSSDLIVLPITSGGGSNLKTAEAILSGKKIVSTDYALRGFEEYLSLPNIYIANDKDAFTATIIKALKSEYIDRSKEEITLANQVTWDTCLKPISPAIKTISRTDLRFVRNKLWMHTRGFLGRLRRALSR